MYATETVKRLSSLIWTPYFYKNSQRWRPIGRLCSYPFLVVLWVTISRSFSSENCKVKPLTSQTNSSNFWKQGIYIDMHPPCSPQPARYFFHLSLPFNIYVSHPSWLQVICGYNNVHLQTKFRIQVLKRTQHWDTPGVQTNMVHLASWAYLLSELRRHLGFPHFAHESITRALVECFAQIKLCYMTCLVISLKKKKKAKESLMRLVFNDPILASRSLVLFVRLYHLPQAVSSVFSCSPCSEHNWIKNLCRS